MTKSIGNFWITTNIKVFLLFWIFTVFFGGKFKSHTLFEAIFASLLFIYFFHSLSVFISHNQLLFKPFCSIYSFLFLFSVWILFKICILLFRFLNGLPRISLLVTFEVSFPFFVLERENHYIYCSATNFEGKSRQSAFRLKGKMQTR